MVGTKLKGERGRNEQERTGEIVGGVRQGVKQIRIGIMDKTYINHSAILMTQSVKWMRPR